MHAKKKWPFNRCTDRYTKIVKFLLHMGADVTLQNYDGDTPLHLAAEFEMEYIVKLLLHYNADVNITNKKDENAADSAKNNIYPHVRVLLEDNKFYSKGNTYIQIANNVSGKHLFTSVPQTNRQLTNLKLWRVYANKKATVP